MTASQQSLLISVVVPIYNEEGNVEPLYKELCSVFDDSFHRFELIFVDDGSQDSSVETIEKLCSRDNRIRLLVFSRNFGHQIAITAGMDEARGDAVITMDADLQHPPSVIPAMIEKWQQGNDIVYTVRKDSESTGWFKRTTARMFYSLINSVTRTKIIQNAADFRLMDRSAARTLSGLRERNRFVRGLVSWIGFRQAAIPFEVQDRHSGESKYTIRKMLSFAFDGITSFSSTPLRLSAYLGFFVAIATVPYALWAVYVRFFMPDETVAGWTSVIVAVLFLGAVQLLSLGILGEYVGRVYDEVKRRPLYIVRERHGMDATDDVAERTEPRQVPTDEELVP